MMGRPKRSRTTYCPACACRRSSHPLATGGGAMSFMQLVPLESKNGARHDGPWPLRRCLMARAVVTQKASIKANLACPKCRVFILSEHHATGQPRRLLPLRQNCAEHEPERGWGA